LLIVIVLMSILAKLAITSAASSAYEQLCGTANIIAGELAYGRSLAVGNNSSYCFDIDTTGNRLVMHCTGADATLNALPNSPFRSPSDPADQYIIRLANLPRMAMAVSLLGAQAVGSSTQSITSIEFGPYGATTQPNQSVLWLTTGLGAGRRYISISINPVTGLATVGSYTGVAPSGITIPTP
jgi:Tfp pilus assembly protein FimT